MNAHQEATIVNPLPLLQEMSIMAMLSMLIAVVPAFMGAGYAIWPTESKLALMRPLSLASLFGALAGFVAGLINGLRSVVVQNLSITSSAALVGFCESLVPLFVSFGALTVAWLLVALGMRRQG
jgi:thiamine transporter ThiT